MADAVPRLIITVFNVRCCIKLGHALSISQQAGNTPAPLFFKPYSFFNQRFVQHTVHLPLAEFEFQLTNMKISVAQLYNDNMVQVQGKLSSHPYLDLNPI